MSLQNAASMKFLTKSKRFMSIDTTLIPLSNTNHYKALLMGFSLVCYTSQDFWFYQYKRGKYYSWSSAHSGTGNFYFSHFSMRLVIVLRLISIWYSSFLMLFTNMLSFDSYSQYSLWNSSKNFIFMLFFEDDPSMQKRSKYTIN